MLPSTPVEITQLLAEHLESAADAKHWCSAQRQRADPIVQMALSEPCKVGECRLASRQHDQFGMLEIIRLTHVPKASAGGCQRLDVIMVADVGVDDHGDLRSIGRRLPPVECEPVFGGHEEVVDPREHIRRQPRALGQARRGVSASRRCDDGTRIAAFEVSYRRRSLASR
jgi:hypothetical protein